MSRILYIGKSGTGKTTLMLKNLEVLKKKTKAKVILFSPTAWRDKVYKSKKKLIDIYFQEVDEKAISFINKTMKKSSQKKKYIFIVDDLGEDTTLTRGYKDNPVRDLAIAARHYDVVFIGLYQKPSQPPPILRENAELVFAFKITGDDNKKFFWKNYLDELTKKEFEELVEFVWEKPYDYLIIDRREPGGKVKLYKNGKIIKNKFKL